MKDTNRHNHFFLLLILLQVGISTVHAQVKIGTNPAVVNNNSVLELESTSKGLLLPRSTTAQITGMAGVPTGMILFNTSDSAIYMKRDTGWIIIPVSKRGVNPTLTTATFADFYALMPSDNAGIVFPGQAIQFPQNSASSGTGIFRSGTSTFILQDIGSYEIMFAVSVTEPAQLMVSLNGTPLTYTAVGRGSGTTQIVGMSIITTSVINSTLSVINSNTSPAAITITPNAGGSGLAPVSAHLMIKKL